MRAFSRWRRSGRSSTCRHTIPNRPPDSPIVRFWTRVKRRHSTSNGDSQPRTCGISGWCGLHNRDAGRGFVSISSIWTRSSAHLRIKDGGLCLARSARPFTGRDSMDFREFAAKEAAELAARLTEAATTNAAQAAREAADEAQRFIDTLRGQLQTETSARAAAAGQVRDAQALAEYLQTELKSATERTQLARLQLDEARQMAERLEAARGELAVPRDEQAGARKAAEADLRDARRTAESLREELTSAKVTLERTTADRLASEEAAAVAHSQSQAAEAKLAAVTDLLKNSATRVTTLEQMQYGQTRRIQDLEAELQARRSEPPPAASLVLDDLTAGLQALAAATTITDVLTKLTEQMAAQFPRVALFRVKKGHLQGEHQIGFDDSTDIGKLVLPLGMDSLPSRAASSGEIEI